MRRSSACNQSDQHAISPISMQSAVVTRKVGRLRRRAAAAQTRAAIARNEARRPAGVRFLTMICMRPSRARGGRPTRASTRHATRPESAPSPRVARAWRSLGAVEREVEVRRAAQVGGDYAELVVARRLKRRPKPRSRGSSTAFRRPPSWTCRPSSCWPSARDLQPSWCQLPARWPGEPMRRRWASLTDSREHSPTMRPSAQGRVLA